VHWTQIISNKVHNVDLCEDCAKKKGVTNPGGFSFADVLLKAAPGPDAMPVVRCEQCGFTQNDFKKHGRFGCPACYDAFKGMLEPLLDGMHKGTKHEGKVPRTAMDRQSLYDRMTKLESELTDAIKAERYEEAARYRDEINQMKQAAAPKPAS
jgi:protein arginine kinase activator